MLCVSWLSASFREEPVEGRSIVPVRTERFVGHRALQYGAHSVSAVGVTSGVGKGRRRSLTAACRR